MSNTPNVTMESMAQAIQELQGQLANAAAELNSQKALLDNTTTQLQNVTQELVQTKQEAQMRNSAQVKTNKPPSYKGKGSVTSWATHMDNYLRNVDPLVALPIAVSYLEDGAHEWWIVFKETNDGKVINSWPELRSAVVARFDTLNKEKVARDKLAKWKQVKDVTTFNQDFQNILLDIPDISMKEQVDRYTRGLKLYIWKELCTKDYGNLADAMKDAERVEAAHRRIGNPSKNRPDNKVSHNTVQKPTPMDIGNIQINRLSKEERIRCMKEGLCLRCREKGHMTRNCPKARRN